MAANHHLSEKMQEQFNTLDADIKRTLWAAYTEEPEDIEWNTETVFSRKRNQKTIRVSFDTKLKRYTTIDPNNIVPENKAIKIHLGDMFIHYKYHPGREKHIYIANPPRSEINNARYVTMVQNCHLIKGRDITVGVSQVLIYKTAAHRNRIWELERIYCVQNPRNILKQKRTKYNKHSSTSRTQYELN